MADIKTRNIKKGTVKALDRSAVLADKTKSAVIRTKEGTENNISPKESSAEEYASGRAQEVIQDITDDALHQFTKRGKNGIRDTKDNIEKVKKNVKKIKDSFKKGNKSKKTVKKIAQTTKKTVQQTTKTTSKTAKTATKGTIKTAQKSVKTAQTAGKVAVKTTKETAKAAKVSAKASAKAAQAAARATRVAIRATIAGIKLAVKVTVYATKAIIAAVKAIVAAIATGGWVTVVIIIVICVVALIVCSVFGIFFSGKDSGTGQTIQTAVQEINTEYDNKLLEIKNGSTHDVLEMSGSRAVWKDVLAVYAVKTNTDPDNPQEVATMDDNKKQLLKDLFWEMNEISSRTESISETVITETDDGSGNIVQTETTVTRTYLYITVTHKTVDEMASEYGFNQEQKDYLTELLKPEYDSLWSAALYGINYSDNQIVTVALTQIGNVGGEPYWSWYGFGSRVEWCACFVSWCANECGYIDTGVIPKFAGCDNGMSWFKNRSQWIDGSKTPTEGMIIFFDWTSNGQDGTADHVGIVQKIENHIIYTVEGNSGDTCRINQYPIGYAEILGYGIPMY